MVRNEGKTDSFSILMLQSAPQYNGSYLSISDNIKVYFRLTHEKPASHTETVEQMVHYGVGRHEERHHHINTFKAKCTTGKEDFFCR